MIGNLSKSLVKVPAYFKYLSSYSSEKSRIVGKNFLDTFNQLNRNKYENESNNKRYKGYFRSRDFAKRNLNFDFNYNNNRRYQMPNHTNLFPVKTFEEFLAEGGEVNNTRSNYNTIGTQSETDDLHSNNSLTKTKRIYLNNCNEIIKDENITEFNDTIKSNVTDLINKINNNSEVSFVKGKMLINRIKNSDIDKSKFGFINSGRVIEPPLKFKFPRNNKLMKSQDSLFLETIDMKLNSLTTTTSNSKKQNQNKNRLYASMRQFNESLIEHRSRGDDNKKQIYYDLFCRPKNLKDHKIFN